MTRVDIWAGMILSAWVAKAAPPGECRLNPEWYEAAWELARRLDAHRPKDLPRVTELSDIDKAPLDQQAERDVPL